MNFLEILSATPSLGSKRLRLQFTELGDRVQQQLQFHTPEGDSIVLLESSDQNGDVGWPTSPPIQQVLAEDRGTDKVMLGVGMYAKHHWSLSVLSTPHHCLFEVACRPKLRAEENPPFQSSYHVLGGGVLTETPSKQENCLRIQWPELGKLIVKSRQEIQVSDSKFAVGTYLANGAPTVAWDYEWQWEEDI